MNETTRLFGGLQIVSHEENERLPKHSVCAGKPEMAKCRNCNNKSADFHIIIGYRLKFWLCSNCFNNLIELTKKRGEMK